jgi:uncharacterized DUF497 family protein
VFDDLYALTQRDLTFEAEERWITLGAIGAGSILLVVHTFYEEQNEEVIRVIQLARLTPTKGRHMRKLTEVQRRDIKAVAAKRDEDIDFSDAPPIPDWNGAESASSTGQKRSPNDALGLRSN